MTGAIIDSDEVPSNNVADTENQNLAHIKHPLQNCWSIWLLMVDDSRSWEENLIKLTSFDTVEDFWCLYHHMKAPSELSVGQDYAIFKNDIRPTWEDQANRAGGRWLISFEKKRNSLLDSTWLYTVLLLIGENFLHSNAISGVVVNVRVKSKIGVWVTDAKNKNAVLEIGHTIRDQLNLGFKINFHEHNSGVNKYCI